MSLFPKQKENINLNDHPQMKKGTDNEIVRLLFQKRFLFNKPKLIATAFILGIILHLRKFIQINIISFCLQKGDTGSGPLYPIVD